MLVQVLCKIDTKTGLSCESFLGGNIYEGGKRRELEEAWRSNPWEGEVEGAEWVDRSATLRWFWPGWLECWSTSSFPRKVVVDFKDTCLVKYSLCSRKSEWGYFHSSTPFHEVSKWLHVFIHSFSSLISYHVSCVRCYSKWKHVTLFVLATFDLISSISKWDSLPVDQVEFWYLVSS